MSSRPSTRARTPVPRLITSPIMLSISQAFCRVITRGALSFSLQQRRELFGLGRGQCHALCWCAAPGFARSCHRWRRGRCLRGLLIARSAAFAHFLRLGLPDGDALSVLDALDEIGADLVAAVGEGRIAGRHFKRRGRQRAQGECQVVGHIAGSKPKREAYSMTSAVPTAAKQADRDEVARVHQRFAQPRRELPPSFSGARSARCRHRTPPPARP